MPFIVGYIFKFCKSLTAEQRVRSLLAMDHPGHSMDVASIGNTAKAPLLVGISMVQANS